MRNTSRAGVLAGIVALSLLTAACTASPSDSANPITRVLSVEPEVATTTTTAWSPAPIAPPSRLEVLLVIGDSVGAQLFGAIEQRSRARGGPEVRFLLAVGPGFSDRWPEPLTDLVDDPDTTAAVTSFGLWLALPPAQAADQASLTTMARDIRRFLTPIAQHARAEPLRLILVHSIDRQPDDARVQRANGLIRRQAEALGLEVELTMPGLRDDGSRTQVLIDGEAHLVRGEGEVMHFCAAAALVMADRLLDDYGIAPRPPTAADLAELLAATADTGYFPEIGCRTLVPA